MPKLDRGGLEEKEKSKAEAIGVVWDTRLTTSSNPVAQLKVLPECFISRIGMIVEEC